MLIITISEVRRNITQIVRQIQENSEIAIITQHGKAVAVLLSYEQYNELIERSVTNAQATPDRNLQTP
ncbi:MAG: type II toxin-antitoxin system Phd/YefM family antitoxin [Chloroflexi bacterium]|nr:type II toxin-antitoxin system Phd/YefM family antitoxin [Chloroflexota bacterium]